MPISGGCLLSTQFHLHLWSCFRFGHIGQHCYVALSCLMCIQHFYNKLHCVIGVSKFLHGLKQFNRRLVTRLGFQIAGSKENIISTIALLAVL